MKKSKNKSLLIVCKEQFGYLTDVYKWCEYLRDEYDITMLTLNDGAEKIRLDGIRNIYVPNGGTRLLRGLLFMLYSFASILVFKGLIVVCHFDGCIYFKTIFPNKRMLLDIRTLDVSDNEAVRKKNDSFLRKCVSKYDFVTCISEGVRSSLGLSKDKSAILPLGAEIVCNGAKSFDSLHLLYVGTLYNRHIETTIDGFSMALDKLGHDFDIEYDILGTGLGDEENILNSHIARYGLEDKVHLHGYVRHDCLNPFFEKCNVGVSFVPITEYYENQPPTKTFEYALSGLYVIATDTYSNREVITPDNGCLIQDSAEDFCRAITNLVSIHPDSNKIRKSLDAFRWEAIVDGIMKPILLDFQKIYK